jgi:Cu(I)/Ag(I) efflux system protein CusF
MRTFSLAGGVLAAVLFAATAIAADGTVKKIDEAAGKITLDHGPIRNLDMEEPMTMVFKAAMLRSLKVGDRVTFEADRVNGQITVIGIRKK